MINNIKKYFFDTLNINIEFLQFSQPELNKLPYYLQGTYYFYRANLFNKEIVFIEKKSKEPFTALQYKKHINLIEAKLNRQVVLVLHTIESYNRTRLIIQNINFIIPGKQIFMPFLLIDINENITRKEIFKDTLLPATQAVLLFHLQREPLQSCGIRAIAEKLNYTEMTIGRVVKEMLDKKICSVLGKKDIVIEFELNKRQLWNSILPYLKSPVIKTMYVDIIPEGLPCYNSNISALSYYTNIADDNIRQLAVAKYHYNKEIRNNNFHKTNLYEGNIYMEVWNYDPGRINNNKDFVDPLSLYLIFKDDEDERIQIELEKLIDNIL
jgi:hypothetical protein